MPKQWVDITTIDNNTPFMRVRWKGATWKGGNGPDCWFAEASGLTTDNMRWSQGTKDYGWYSAHRMNGGNYRGYPIYGCSFNFDHTASGYWDVSGTVYQDHTKDTPVTATGFYDTTVVIDGTTYYEIDFSLWSGASSYQLYMPYSNPLNKWSAGDIYVEIGTSAVVIDTESITFQSTGGSDTIVVTADDDWTAVISDNWITASTISGQSGTTTITISTPDYQDTTTNRTGTVVFTCSGDSVTLTVTQRKAVAPSSLGNVYLGDLGAENMYLGDLQVEAMYLGDSLIFPTTFTGIRLKPASFTFAYTGGTGSLKVKSSTGWTLSYDSNYITVDQASGGSGETTVSITAATNSGQSVITTVITATTSDNLYSATTDVVINYNQPFPSKTFVFNYNAKDYDATTYTIPNKSGAMFNQNMVWTATSSTIRSQITSNNDHITIPLSGYSYFSFSTTGDNPFNITDAQPNMTLVGKVKITNNTNGSNFIANRDQNNYNWMSRLGSNFISLHTSTQNVTGSDPATYTSANVTTFVIRVNNKQVEIKNLTDNTTNTPFTPAYMAGSVRLCFFGALTRSSITNLREPMAGDFYWCYLSREVLTDAEIQQVVNYNDNL